MALENNDGPDAKLMKQLHAVSPGRRSEAWSPHFPLRKHRLMRVFIDMIGGKGMIIRSAAPEDAEELLKIYAHYVLNTAVSFEYEVPSPEEFRGRVTNTLKKYPYLVLEDGGRIQGYAYAGVFKPRAAYDRSCEMTIYLDRDAKGRGYGRALYEAMEERLKAQGILNLYACIGDPVTEDEYLTKDSERFHRHLGYEKVGEFHKCGYKFNRWYNMIWMEKFIGEHEDGLAD